MFLLPVTLEGDFQVLYAQLKFGKSKRNQKTGSECLAASRTWWFVTSSFAISEAAGKQEYFNYVVVCRQNENVFGSAVFVSCTKSV